MAANEKKTGALNKEITAVLVNGRLSCPMAFKASRKLDIAPRTVGEKADDMGVRITDCQLGCFGVKKATHEDLIGVPVDNSVAVEIRSSLADGALNCESAWGIARQLKVSRKKVGDTATQLRVSIANCQLGCF